MGNNPASVNRATGQMYLNLELFKKIKPEHRLFIMLHEMAHVVLQSTNEKEVDEWAFREYAKRGYSLKEAVYSLTDLLKGNNLEHYERIKNQLERAKDYDFHFYGNKKIYSATSNFNGNQKREQMKTYLQNKAGNIQKREAAKRKLLAGRTATIKNNLQDTRVKKIEIDQEIKEMKERAAVWMKENPFKPVPRHVLWPATYGTAPIYPRPMKP